jgi:hypothetical protein
MWDYKYRGYTIGERWSEMTGQNDSTFGYVFRMCVFSFCVFTALDPTTSYYMSPFMWSLVWGFIYFYL